MNDFQKSKLTEDEYKFCAESNDRLLTADIVTVAQRAVIIEDIRSRCRDKFDVVITQEYNLALETTEIYRFDLNGKANYIFFDTMSRQAGIIPAANSRRISNDD